MVELLSGGCHIYIIDSFRRIQIILSTFMSSPFWHSDQSSDSAVAILSTALGYILVQVLVEGFNVNAFTGHVDFLKLSHVVSL